MKPRVLLVSRTRYRLPLEPDVAAKFESMRRELAVHVLATGSGEAEGFALLSDSPSFWPLLPFRAARELRRVRPAAVICQSPYEAAAVLVARPLSGARPRVVAEVHGDWRASSRLYGHAARRLLAPFADAVAAWALRRADAVRVVSPFTAELVRRLGVEPVAVFPTYTQLDAFQAPRVALPEQPLALFVGALEATKGIDVLVEAARRASLAARLRLVGDGTQASLVASLGARWERERLPAPAIAAALDEAWALVLPSRSEGLPRIVIEAFCRGRAVVGARAGGIPDIVEDGVSGLLVPPGDAQALAEALERLLSDRQLAERLGEGAAAAAARWAQTPEEHARRLREVVS
jgi:glycosyltransferase involved in cell wall biosynthesis